MNKNILISVVLVAALLVAGYLYVTYEEKVDVASDMQKVIPTSSANSSSSNPDDVSNSVDSVNMAELNAQISADIKAIDSSY